MLLWNKENLLYHQTSQQSIPFSKEMSLILFENIFSFNLSITWHKASCVKLFKFILIEVSKTLACEKRRKSVKLKHWKRFRIFWRVVNFIYTRHKAAFWRFQKKDRISSQDEIMKWWYLGNYTRTNSLKLSISLFF